METLEERDRKLEELWAEFEDVPMDPDTEQIEDDFLHFPHGTGREEIWHWFDERHSKGVTYLLYSDGVDRTDEHSKLVYLHSLCDECESKSCAYSKDDLVFIVTGANIAGYMEHAGTIVVDDDAHLAMFIVFQYEEYCSDNGDENWTEFIERALQRRYAPEGTEPDIAPTRLAEIGRNAIDAYGEMMNGRALYDCLAGNLKMNDEEIIGAGFSSLQEFMADAPKLTVRVEYKPGDDKIITTSVYDHRTGTFWTQEQISERGIESFASVADLKVVLNWNLNGDESKYRFSWKDTWPTLYKGIARVYQ